MKKEDQIITFEQEYKALVKAEAARRKELRYQGKLNRKEFIKSVDAAPSKIGLSLVVGVFVLGACILFELNPIFAALPPIVGLVSVGDVFGFYNYHDTRRSEYQDALKDIKKYGNQKYL